MEIRYTDPAGAAGIQGTAVVVDVLRAFTTAAYGLGRGALGVRLVASAAEALAWRDARPGALAIGEDQGRPIPGFDLGNSPLELVRTAVAGRWLVQRTTAGTQGVVRARGAQRRYATSFVVASATAAHLAAVRPEQITFVITGAHDDRDGDEDRACAEYIAARLQGAAPDPEPFLERVRRSTAGRHFTDGASAHLDVADLEAATALDALPFALVVDEDDVLRAEAPPPPGDAVTSR